MEKALDYKKLYLLQDKVLSAVFSLNNGFYLTGGTALHRFYYNARYSDDLDFFTSNDDLFSEAINEIRESLKEDFSLDHTVETRDFHRFLANDLLQLDFVNDRVYREGKSRIIRGIKVDNEVNILANKITAIISRDEAKDIFDLFYIAVHKEFSWDDMLLIANKKSKVDKETLINRLKTFPLSWLSNIKIIEPFSITDDMIQQISGDILLGQDNSLHINR